MSFDQATVYVGPMLDPDEIRIPGPIPVGTPMPAWKVELNWMGDELAAVEFDWPPRRRRFFVVDSTRPEVLGPLVPERPGIFTQLAYIPGRYLP